MATLITKHLLIWLSKRNVIDLSKDLFSRHEKERATQIRQIECEVVCDMFLAHFFLFELISTNKKTTEHCVSIKHKQGKNRHQNNPIPRKKQRKKTPIPTV